jgi:hypothetical protein
MTDETYEPWSVPSPARTRRENPRVASLRMDRSRVSQQLERASHKNHIKMLKRALRDIDARIKEATQNVLRRNGKS